MRIIADLHLHSKYARATSQNSDLQGLSEGAKMKGVQVVATGDFTHPEWFKELKMALENRDNESGLYDFNGAKFLLSVEVANLFHINGELKKMHHVILAPNFEVAAQINDRLAKRGNLAADGRPIFGKYPAAELVEEVIRRTSGHRGSRFSARTAGWTT
jgi:PHP family Zn ribbon phosphoesterase